MKDKYATLELDESENSEYKKVNLTDLVDNIVTKLGEEPSLKKEIGLKFLIIIKIGFLKI